MATLSVWIYRPFWSPPAVVTVGALAVLAAGGCASNIYSARRLPAEFRAAPADSFHGPLPDLIPEETGGDWIGRGDELEVQIFTGLGREVPATRIRVEEDGAVDVPLIRRVAVAGLTLDQARQAITAAAIQRGIFKNPHVSLAIKEPATNRVTVLGAVPKPNSYDLPRPSSTLLAALMAAGGLSEDAAPVVDIRQPARPGNIPNPFEPAGPRLAGATEAEAAPPYAGAAIQPPRMIRINLDASDGTKQNPHLGDGDVVVVARQPDRSIMVGGLVRRPNRYKLPYQQEVRVSDAVWIAGGKSSPFADKVLITRQFPGREPIRIKSSLLEARYDPEADLPLAPGDSVAVEETPLTFAWSVTERIIRIGLSLSGRILLW